MNKLEVENKLKDNKLPDGWAKVKLDSLLIESKERNITNKKLLVFSITNVKGFVLQDEYFSHNIHSEKTTNYKIFRENYFGYNPARINVGSIALSEKQREGLLSPMYVIFKTKSTLNPKYLKYFIQSSHFKNNVINNVAGSVRESLNYSSLEMFDFIYPISISEQNRIAEILETVDETIEKTEAIIEKNKRIKQGLMQDLLTGGITAFEFEKDKLIHAVKKAFENGDHKFGREENLVSHLSRHLEDFFPEWDVDNEVEKNNERQRPDIIIHKRKMDENLFAIEVKKNENLNAIKQDIKKLEDVMLGDYHYEDVVFIGFNIENFDDVFKLSEKVNFILVSKNGEIKVKPRVRRFKDSLLGKIPEEWEVVELGGLVEINPEKVNYSSIEFIRYIDIESIKDGKINKVKLFFKNDAPSRAQRLIRKNDVVVSTVRPNLKSFALVNKKFDGFVCSTGFAVLRAKEKELNSKYLLYLTFYDEIFLRQIIPMIVGSNYPAISSNDLNNILVLHPSLPEQHRIVSILSQIDETIEKEQNYKEKLERIKQGLMEDLLTGKVRVNHLIKEAVESV